MVDTFRCKQPKEHWFVSDHVLFLLLVYILILSCVIKLILSFPKKWKTFINSVLMFVNLLGMKQWSAKGEPNCQEVRNKGSPLLGLLSETHKFCCWMKRLQLWTLRVKRLCRKLWIMSGKKLQKMTLSASMKAVRVRHLCGQHSMIKIEIEAEIITTI